MYRTNRTWLIIALALSALLMFAHFYALSEYLYWQHRWLDIPMHMLGGAALGALIFAFGTGRRTATFFLLILCIVLGWEIFEYFAHISTGQPHYGLDTAKDIVDGLAGSAVTFVIGRKTSWR